MEARSHDRLDRAGTHAPVRQAPSRDVARALFNEHLDLAAIRKALGQPVPRHVEGPNLVQLSTEGLGGSPAHVPDEAVARRRLPPSNDLPAGSAITASPGWTRQVSYGAIAAAVGATVVLALAIGADHWPPGSWFGNERAQWSVPQPSAIVRIAPMPVQPASALAATEMPAVTTGKGVAVARPPRLTDPRTDAPPALLETEPNAISARMAISAPATPAKMPEVGPLRIARNLVPPPVGAILVPPASETVSMTVRAMDETAIPGANSGRGAVVSNSASETPGNQVAPIPGPPLLGSATGRGTEYPKAPTARAVIHHRLGTFSSIRGSLTDALRRAGFAEVEWRPVADTVSRDQTRYFHDGDRVLSDKVLAVLTSLGRPGNPEDFTHYTPSPRAGTVEIWLSD